MPQNTQKILPDDFFTIFEYPPCRRTGQTQHQVLLQSTGPASIEPRHRSGLGTGPAARGSSRSKSRSDRPPGSDWPWALP
eukprot:867299-Pyramimonas_sp.AAC.1